MNLPISISLFAILTAATAWAEMRDAATREERAPSNQKAPQNDPAGNVAQAKASAPTPDNPAKSLLADSDILCFNGMATLVPKQAVIQIPKNLADRLKYIPGSKLLSWPDFYAVNRGWITTVEVSPAQAEGQTPLADGTQKQMAKSSNLIVATYRGGPISVLPPEPKVQVSEAPAIEANAKNLKL